MSTVLYVTAHPLAVNQSYSLSVGQAFVKSYQENHAEDEVIHLDLYKEFIPTIDLDVFSGWGKLGSGAGFDELTQEEASRVARLGELVDQFVSADKYVFVTPMWNFMFPPVMKAYFDAVSIADKTFKYTAQGPVGLLKGKKAIHIQSSGGIYSEGPGASIESGHRYIGVLMHFFGVTDFDGIFVEGHAQFPDRAEEIKASAIQVAQQKAIQF